MNYHQVLQDIERGEIAPVYLLYGEEPFLIRQIEQAAVRHLLAEEDRESSLFVYDQDPPATELANLVDTPPFFGSKNLILIRDTRLFRAGNKSNEETSDNPGRDPDEKIIRCLLNMPGFSHIVFSAGEKVDKRRKLYKTIEKVGVVCEAAPLKSKDARVWIDAKMSGSGKVFSSAAMEELMTALSLMPQISLGFLDNEIDKLLLYAGKEAKITPRHLQAVLSASPEVSIFSMIEALSQKRAKEALQLLAIQVNAGENLLRIVALLARQIRHLLYAKDLQAAGGHSRGIGERLGVPPFVAEKIINQGKGFPRATLRQALVDLAEIDRGLKNGTAGIAAVEALFINMCG